MTSDVVVLIPGFLGFDRIGHFPYFANRVGAALRGCLVGLSGKDIPVIPVKTCPTDSLARRQISLLQALQKIDCLFGPVDRLHLVGHSTGGVDAYLLTGEKPLFACRTWRELDPHRLRHKIGTVISVASPHAGTCLALSPLARFIRHPLWSIDKSPSLALTLLRLPLSLRVDEMALGALLGAITDTGGAAAYMLDVLWSRTLVDDLRPQNLVQIHEQFQQGLEKVHVRSVVTAAGRQTKNYTAGSRSPAIRKPDAFFEGMYGYTAGCGFDDTYDDCGRVERGVTLIKEAIAGDNLIKNPGTELREVTSMLNDGLVNSARQLVNPHNSEELLTVVIGDHIDVMGYYPRWAPTSEDPSSEKQAQLRSGILHSGSGFGDVEFFAMLQQIAKEIVLQSAG